MSRRSWWWLGLAGVIGLLPAVSLADNGSSDNGSDQRSQSHVPIPLHGMDLQQALADRFQALKNLTEAKESFQKSAEEFLKNSESLKNKEKLNQLYQLFKNIRPALDPSDPLLRDLGKKLEQNLSPEEQKSFRGFIDEIKNPLLGKPNESKGGSLTPEGNGEPSSPEGTDPDDRKNILPKTGDLGRPPGADPLRTDSEEEQNLLQKGTRWLAEQAEEGTWTDSPAVRELIREFKRPHLEMGGWSGLDENSWSGKLAGLSRSLVQSPLWPEVDWSRLGKIRAPSNLDLPKVKMPWKPPSSSGIPRIPLPSASSLNRGLGLLWVAIIIVLAVVVWKYLRARSAEQASRQSRAWKLGPWPVSPAAVASREELILAFEYLSLLKLGPAARSRNHLALADALGNQESGVRGQESGERRRTAQHLASLYELARYAPDRNPFSDDALTAARRELCFLAETAL